MNDINKLVDTALNSEKQLRDQIKLVGDLCDFRDKIWRRAPGKDNWFPQYGRLILGEEAFKPSGVKEFFDAQVFAELNHAMLKETSIEWDRAVTIDNLLFVQGSMQHFEQTDYMIFILDTGKEVT